MPQENVMPAQRVHDFFTLLVDFTFGILSSCKSACALLLSVTVVSVCCLLNANCSIFLPRPVLPNAMLQT